MSLGIKGIDTSKIVIDKTRKLASSYSTTKGFMVIGIKDKPTKKDIIATIRHEFAHTKIRGAKKTFRSKNHHTRVLTELQVYKFEKQHTNLSDWNEILPTRINDFIPYITWETEKEQKISKRIADRILTPKKGGGNLTAIKRATDKISGWWQEEPIKIKPRVEKLQISKSRVRITPKTPRLKR